MSRLLSAGATSLCFAMELAVRFDQARILKMLLTAVHAGESDGPRVAELVNSGPLLRLDALHVHPGVTNVLLATGADETRETNRGERARDLIGIFVQRERSGKRGCNRAHAAAGSSFPFSIVGLADRVGWFHHFS